MRVEATRAFLRDLKMISKSDAEDTVTALEAFVSSQAGRKLNFEPVVHRVGYFTIRSNYSIRVLLRKTGKDVFDVVAVGKHDYIYASYFRK